MNEVRTYRSEDHLNDDNNKNSKKVLCPKCDNIGYIIVKKECDCTAFFVILFFPPLILCAFSDDFFKKEVHFCIFCHHDCTDVKAYEESHCLLI